MILVDVCQVSPRHMSVDACKVWLTLFQNIIGMSVVGGDYDRLKRFNLAEIYDPGPKTEPKGEGKVDAKDSSAGDQGSGI